MLEKLTDYLIAASLSFVLVASMFFDPVISNRKDIQEIKKEVSRVSSRIEEVEDSLSSYKIVMNDLGNKGDLSLAMKVNTLEKAVDKNAKVLADIDGLIAKEPEKYWL